MSGLLKNDTICDMKNVKTRYDILDGLRGVAAILVVVSHVCECYMPSSRMWSQWVGHAHLAVDFFFALSGFVIAYAYDDRWGKMSYWDFAGRRLLRLHPLVVLGCVLGFAVYLIYGKWVDPNMARLPLWMAGLLFAMTCFMLPVPRVVGGVAVFNMNPFNGPNWSLTYEYVANILYALVFRRLGKRMLALLMIIAGVLSVCFVMKFDIWGNLAGRARYSLTAGFGLTWSAGGVYGGFIRLLFPFLMGMFIARSRKFLRLPHAFWLCSAALVAVIMVPRTGMFAKGDGWTYQMADPLNGIFELFCLFVAFPLILCAGAGGEVKNATSVRLCRFLGAISYPLYMVHYPFIHIYHAWAVDNALAYPLSVHVSIAAGFTLGSIFLAWLTLKLYDEPVRRWLSGRKP